MEKYELDSIYTAVLNMIIIYKNTTPMREKVKKDSMLHLGQFAETISMNVYNVRSEEKFVTNKKATSEGKGCNT